jgi:hypothetical protein
MAVVTDEFLGSLEAGAAVVEGNAGSDTSVADEETLSACLGPLLGSFLDFPGRHRLNFKSSPVLGILIGGIWLVSMLLAEIVVRRVQRSATSAG